MAQVTLLKNLTRASATQRIKVRCVHAYNTYWAGKTTEALSLECIMHDEEGVKIHVTFPKSVVHVKGHLINEGDIYLMQNFFVKNSPRKYKTTSHYYKIQIYDKTMITKIEDPIFCWCPCNVMNISDIANLSEVESCPLFDVVGVAKGCSKVVDDPRSKLLELALEDEKLYFNYKFVLMSAMLLCVVLFGGENVDLFLSQRDSQMIVPIVLVRLYKASKFNGQIRCGTVYNASKVCLNKDISVINQFRQS
ncbi:hypothetical protein AAHA92_12009 [Salvia divinorum]|uniref:Replication protein A 70 kDa DNA-binding subunit B/D first OB fold domain-containing protein n=1 Tax=Salvia divinorum TaxID=28513 RepID=A0ABD1HMK3_SALDI